MTGYNWEKIIKDFDTNSSIYDSIKDSTDEFITTYHDSVDWKAGWGHDFHCDYCSGALTFDIKNRGIYKCSICKKENSGDRKDWAWTTSYRSTSCAYVKYAGILYSITKQSKYIDYIRKVMNFLTDNYEKFESFAPNLRFLGRYTGTGLSDAANTMSLLYGIDAAQDHLTKAELDKWHKGFFTPQADMFDFFANKIYNIPLWQKVSEANIGVFFKDEEIIKRAFYSKFGIMDQLRRGVTQDGMWFETSTGYHFFGLAATAELLLLCQRNEVLCIPEHDELMKIIESQFMFPLKIMFKNGCIANPCDSGLDMDIFKYQNAYVKACALFDNPYFKQVLGYIKYKQKQPKTLDEILYGIEYDECDHLPDFGSNNFEDSFCSILKNDVTELYLKTGIKTICHSHPDVMTMEMAFYGDLVSKDIGSAGYSSQIFYEWQHKTIAHNTVVINQKDQTYTPVGEGIWPEGMIEYYDDNHIIAKSKNVYECVDYIRDMKIDSNKVFDVFNIKAVEELEMDYVFYCKGKCIIDCKYENVDMIGSEEGYQHLSDIKRIDNSKPVTIKFDIEDKLVIVTVEPEENSILYVVNSYVNNFNDTRQGIIVRRKGSEETFKVTYECVMK
ncbi:MAG TPA: heparinase II/III family protein [Clostridia bacterium]|nr:heparinase II/III family protein [Clostridia bacterium]